MHKSLDEMTDAEVCLDQAKWLRQAAQSPTCLDPRLPMSRADRFDSIAAKLAGAKAQKPVKMTTQEPAPTTAAK